jgi:hypothetical protein
MASQERTAHDWFAEAARCYVEHHQGCAWCGGSHRVYHIRRANKVEYYCNYCDFRVTYDEAAKRYGMIPGEDSPATIPETMHGYCM